jgi:DNA-binding NarL/FixJ family response regulator
MKNLTHPVPENTIPLRIYPGGDNLKGRSCPLSVLCVSEDPLFLDRICRNLEQSSDIFVEISNMAEDALHLMEYLSFDVIVTDCISWHGELNGFLKTLRKQGMEIPFIYFLKGPETGSMQDVRRYGLVRYLVGGERETTPPFEELIRCIREMTAQSDGEKPATRSDGHSSKSERIV